MKVQCLRKGGTECTIVSYWGWSGVFVVYFKVKVPAVLVSNEALFLAFRRLPVYSVLSLALLHASEERERVGRSLWRLFLFFFFFFNFLFYIGV